MTNIPRSAILDITVTICAYTREKGEIMASGSLQDMTKSAVDMLPKTGEWVEFDKYKADLYQANPSKGRDVFAHLIKNDLVLKKLDTNTNGQVVVFLSRKV